MTRLGYLGPAGTFSEEAVRSATATSWSSASVSSVTLIGPSTEFSIGTIARSTLPSGTARIVSRTVAMPTSSASAPSSAARAASSENVPAGPR